MEEQIQILAAFNLDIILVEGHKFHHFPKAVIINDEKDSLLIEELRNIQVVYFRNPHIREQLNETLLIPNFLLADDECIEWTTYYLKSQLTIR